MKKAGILFLFLFLHSSTVHAAFEYGSWSAKMMSLGNSSLALADEPSVVLVNPGALGFLENKGAQASLARLYDLDELSQMEFCLAWPYHRFGLGAAWHLFGEKDYYQENQFALALSYRTTDFLSLGLNAKFMQVSFSPGYKSLSALSVDVGSLWKVNNKIQLGLVARNLNQPELLEDSDDIPANFCLGLAVFPFKEVTLLLDLTYEDRYKEQLHLGQEINLVKNLPLRFGIQTSPARYSFGTGFNFKRLIVDYAYANHSVLGDTHKISFSYSWGSENLNQPAGNLQTK